MSERLDFYQKQAETRVSTIPWLADLQQSALADFTRTGFPSRYNEAWKYTAIDSFLAHEFSFTKINPSASRSMQHDIPAEWVINISNGDISGLDEITRQLPTGVIIEPLSQALQNHADKIKPFLGQILAHDHGFQALNTAILQSGLFIYLPEGVRLEHPLLLSHWQDEDNRAVYLRHLLVAESGSEACIVEDYNGQEGQCYFTNAMTEIVAAQSARVQHYKIQRESKQAYHIGHLAVRQAADSQVDSHSFSIGGKLVRSDITINLDEPNARCLMNGIYAPDEGQHMDHHTQVLHNVPDCYSEQDYKGILSGRSRAVFNGIVKVAKDAQHTVAKQQNKNILLSANAEVDTKPQLEIFADDVVCTHGATVGQLDEEALFYLATRGIGRLEASRYLIHAFAADNLRLVGEPLLAKWMGQRLTQHLG